MCVCVCVCGATSPGQLYICEVYGDSADCYTVNMVAYAQSCAMHPLMFCFAEQNDIILQAFATEDVRTIDTIGCASIAYWDKIQPHLDTIIRVDKHHPAGCNAAAGVPAQSPIAGQVLAAKQGMRRKSRLQHVTVADDAASPSGEPQQATPGSVTATRAAAHQQRQGQTPQGNGQPGAGDDGGQTPRTLGGSAYMTPPTTSAQRPAVRKCSEKL